MKDKYEISIWEDYLVATDGNIPEHYEERKIAVIGSDNMTSDCKAYLPKLVENINGTNTFTFKMYYNYTEDGIKKPNPFLNLLVNERKIKVLWKKRWYDLIIKNCQENSSDKSITYTCKDLFINELSKTGFDLEFDNELENNQGTVVELGAKVLEGSDWQIDTDTSDIIQQKKDEPVYELITIVELEDVINESQDTTITIPSNSKILVFYQQLQEFINNETLDSTNIDLQFLYAENYNTDTNSQLVIDADCCSIPNIKLTKDVVEEIDCIKLFISNDGDILIGTLFYKSGVSNNYRGNRLVKSQVCEFDPLTGKYCYVYIANRDGTGDFAGLISENDVIYSYRDTKYNDPTFVTNLIINGKDFASTDGWMQQNGELLFQLYPPYDNIEHVSTYNSKSYLRVSQKTTNTGYIYNSGLKDSSNYIPNGVSYGQQFIFRYRATTNSQGHPTTTYITSGLTPFVCNYEDGIEGKIPDLDNQYFSVSSSSFITEENWVEFTITCNKSFTRADIYNNHIGLFLNSDSTYWIEEIQMFPLVYGQDSEGEVVRINPGEMSLQSVATIQYNYYNHTKNSGLISADDLKFLYQSTQSDWNYSGIDAKYNENFEKIRSITAKNSNRFNLLQTLAETFECWCRFTINHDTQGRIIYENGVPQKHVSFVNEVGKETGIGFIYGIDLKSISRTIQSDQIVTKTIVKANSNEFAENGFCTIARSNENYARDTFILNFDYYINHGLIDGNELNKDLYLSVDSIGYYYNLNRLNTEFSNLSDLISQKENELLKQNSYLTTYDNYISSLQEQQAQLQSEVMRLANVTTWDAATQYIKQNPNATEIKTRMIAYETYKSTCNSYISMRTDLQTSIDILNETLEEKRARKDEIIEELKDLHLRFYKKYSRYIQEGSWINEDYIDDNLYYLDAQSVAYTSSRPQISYDISVFRISSQPEFENKIFNLGDISFIQDTEFFGYTYINQVKTPYKEKVLVSEVTSNFDEPDKDTFRVQNYKTQFEDLFQRITSTTQNLQYASGEYAKAAAIVESDGTINKETLQSSIALNSELVFSAQNEAIIQDSTGLTVSDTTNPNYKTKITSGGLFITTDGGATWKNAIRGEGLSTQYLTTGAINTSNISVMDGNFQTFRWDSNGINAFYQMGEQQGINLSKFVRFDHFGIYGINSNDGDNYVPTSEDDIWDDASFGMTWKGFFVKNKGSNGYVEVSSENDILVSDNIHDRIKIGRIGTDGTNIIYGIRINNANGVSVMETASDGTLWLKNELNISSSKDSEDENLYDISIGYLNKYKALGSDIHQIFNANDKFIVNEDGSMEATDGRFSGYIEATGGKIGNLTINSADGTISDISKIDIISNLGYNFSVNESSFSPSALTLKVEPIGLPFDNNPTIMWYHSSDFTNWALITGATSDEYEISYDNFYLWQNENRCYIKVRYITSALTEYNGFVTLYQVKDGHDGGDTDKYRIVTNQEEILKYYESDTLKFSPSRLNIQFKINETDTLVTNFSINYSDISNNQQNIKSLLTTSDNYYILDIEEIFSEFENLDSTIPGYIYIDWTVDSFHITKTLPLRFMMQDDQAKLALHAGGIVASIQNSKLEFGADGLMIKNGGLEIKNSDEITVFEADSNGNLILNNITANNGTFNGEINATSGTFNGAIYATSGTFNGEVNATSGTFTGEVHATNGTFNGEVNATSGTFTGTINAANGEIGGFQIDATSIYTNNSDIKLDSGTKTLKIGNIVINGINSTINGDIFSITPTQAIFNNIIAKGKISTSIFENAKIQSMGGSMIFRPTYKIIAYTSTTITLETNFQGYTDNDGNFITSYIYIIDDNGNIDSFNKIESINGSTITVATELDSSHNIYYIIDIGPNGSLLLGTNSNTSANRFLLPEGITFSTLNVNSDGQDNFTTNLFLGNLTTLNYSGYGLYGDNVILNGSLTTKSGTNKYAGVNTISQVHFIKGYNDESPIIFWAGSVSDSSADIVNSPFQVTENGTIYASQGVFTGSIISDSIIQGADIYAARLHGGIEGNAAPLTIYDSSQGIVFKEQYNTSQEKETFNIKSDGFYTDTNKFISIGNGIHYFGDTATIGSILLNNNRIYSTNEIDNLIIGPDNNNIIAKFDSNQIEFNAPTLTQINSAKTELKSSDIYFNNEKMYYKEIITNNESIGYDLYV